MKNVTITLDEEAARWARVKAARENTSVSRLLGRMLEAEMRSEAAYDAAKGSFLARSPVQLKDRTGYPSRQELHERSTDFR